MNKVVLYIQKDNGDWETFSNVVIPVKYGKLLDEQLDYATVTMQRVKQEVFKPLTRARLTVTSTTEHGGDKTETLDYFIANDDFFESPLGKTPKEYTHNLTLIELTKYLECFPLESLCFTNPSGNNSTRIKPSIEVQEGDDGMTEYTIPNSMFTPLYSGQIRLPNLQEFIIPNSGYDAVPGFSLYENAINSVDIYYGDNQNTRFYYTNNDGSTNQTFDILSLPYAYVNFKIRVSFAYTYTPVGLNTPSAPIFVDFIFNVTYTGYVNPLKPWTIEEVIERTLQLVEPLRENETPRFVFYKSEEQHTEIFDQLAPEFTFTRMNLREAMQTIGGFIHAEPRLILDTVNGEEKYRITFDFYGENEYAVYKNYKTEEENIRLNKYKYTTNTGNFGIEQACTRLDSYMDNLVNRLDWQSATVGQPFGETAGAQTLRTETAYTQEEEGDGYKFPTVYAIDKIVKMEYIHTNGNAYDITAYLFETNIYNTLSSFDSVYPTSKSYALNFTYGQKGIKGFFYKVPNVTSGVGKNYSIVNVINAVMGGDGLGTVTSNFYNTMKFRLTYVPIYSTRIQHGKQYLDDYLPLPRVVNYSQSDNSVETRFFGEHLKGAAQRMGNVEKNVTFIMRNVFNIPNAGELWDDDYYISSVSVSVKQDHFEITCGLSKNFNRKSKYIGASTYKRIYEVSEVMVQERHTVYTDYLVLKPYDANNQALYDEDKLLLTTSAVGAIWNMLNYVGYGTNDYSLSTVYAYGQTKNFAKLSEVFLPVVASSFGNVMEFTWEYKDNFSAGIKSIEDNPNDDDKKLIFGQEVQYSDYYGRMYYYNFLLLTNSETTQSKFIQNPNDYPQISTNNDGINAPSVLAYGIIDRKDSREKEKKTYQIEIVAEDASFVVGSAFASKNPLVYFESGYEAPSLYILPKRINKFSSLLDFTGSVDLDKIKPSNTANLTYAGKTATSAGQAWCLAYPVKTKTYTVSTEDGEVEDVEIKTGGEIVFGQNVDISEGDTVGAFSITAVHDIFKYIQAKNNK